MADDVKDAGKSGSSSGSDGKNDEGRELELELSGETEDQEELFDKDGKPLPWNQSRRFRKIYGEAKEGRKVTNALKELGLKPSDLPRLREEMGRLSQYDQAYAEYLEQQKKGQTDDDDDEGAKEVQKKIKSLKSQLKSLGVKFSEDDEEDDGKTKAKIAEARKQEVIGKARERITELLEDAGVDFESMDKADQKDLLEEFDFKIGQRLARDEEGKAAFIRGSLRPIEKHFKAVLEKANVPVKKMARSSGISNLPPRMSGSSQGSQIRRENKNGPPKNVKDATEDVLADLRARNAAARREAE
jgi:hypothetical protein